MRNSIKTMTCKFLKNKWQQKQWNRDKVNVMHQQNDKFGHQQMVTAPSITTVHSSDDTIFCVAKIEPNTTKESFEMLNFRHALLSFWTQLPCHAWNMQISHLAYSFFFRPILAVWPGSEQSRAKIDKSCKKKGRSADLELEARRRAARFCTSPSNTKTLEAADRRPMDVSSLSYGTAVPNINEFQ